MRALSAAPGEPSQQELAALASKVGGAVGVALAVPAVAKALPATTKTAISGGATLGASAAKPLAVLGAWVVGGLAIGAGLSGVAYSFAPTDGPAPQAHPALSAAARTLQPAAAVREVPEVVASAMPSVDVRALPAEHAIEPKATASGRTAASSPLAPEPPTTPEAESEISLLKRARAVADAAQALALTSQHAKLYPGGALEQEREVIAIDALLRLGRRDEAAQRAKRFQERYPGSAHARRMGTLAEGGSR
jgi:hypothetical protein